jgi:hypothetical protein
MLISDIKNIFRPNTNIKFFAETGLSKKNPNYLIIAELKKSGAYDYSWKISNDGLLFTSVGIFDSMETYSTVETACGIEHDSTYDQYRKLVGIPQLDHRSRTIIPYRQTGIDQPFTCTTTYTFRDNDPFIATFKDSMEQWEGNNNPNRVSVTQDLNTVTVVYKYKNSEDFSQHYFADMWYVPTLHNHGVIRTIQYKLIETDINTI